MLHLFVSAPQSLPVSENDSFFPCLHGVDTVQRTDQLFFTAPLSWGLSIFSMSSCLVDCTTYTVLLKPRIQWQLDFLGLTENHRYWRVKTCAVQSHGLGSIPWSVAYLLCDLVNVSWPCCVPIYHMRVIIEPNPQSCGKDLLTSGSVHNSTSHIGITRWVSAISITVSMQ